MKCIGLVYTMVTDSIKQQQIRTDFESKKSVNDIEIFSSFMAVNNHIQYGKQGPLPTKYTSKEDIEAISLELIHKINNDKRS